jgi:hypothetical protein
MMRRAGYATRTGYRRNEYRVLVGKPEGRRPPEELGVDGTIPLKRT